jgi:hypothetical protein
MAIDTPNKKLALLESDVWTPGIPLDEAYPFSIPDKVQLLWEYPVVPRTTPVVAPADIFAHRRRRIDESFTRHPKMDVTTNQPRRKIFATDSRRRRPDSQE